MPIRKIFIDTNLLVYANDRRDPVKQKKAIAIVSDLMRTGNGVVSTQVLQEYAAVALTKLGQRQDVVLRQLLLLEELEVQPLSPAIIRRGVEIKATYAISFWDASIIAAAEHAECRQIYSEDLNTGQFYAGITVVNPF